MRHADELHEGVRRRQGVRERRAVEWAARDHFAIWMHSGARAGPDERVDAMPPSQESWYQATAEVAGSSRDEDNTRCHGPVYGCRARSDLLHRIRPADVRSGPMTESCLEEQLKRIKELSEQMSRVRALRETDEGRERNQSSDEGDSAPRRPVPQLTTEVFSGCTRRARRHTRAR